MHSFFTQAALSMPFMSVTSSAKPAGHMGLYWLHSLASETSRDVLHGRFHCKVTLLLFPQWGAWGEWTGDIFQWRKLTPILPTLAIAGSSEETSCHGNSPARRLCCFARNGEHGEGLKGESCLCPQCWRLWDPQTFKKKIVSSAKKVVSSAKKGVYIQ